MSRVYNTSGVDSRGCIDAPTRLQYFKIKGMLLTLQGSRVDQIETTLDRDYAVTLQASIDIIDSWSPVDGDSPYISGETKLDAFLRTIVADVTEDKVYADLPVEAQRGFRVNAVDKTLDSSHVDAFHITKWTQFCRLATSMKGYMALVSHQVEVGDIIYRLFGSSVLYVLRPKGDNFWFICEAYVHGLMDGEAMEMLASGGKDGRRDQYLLALISGRISWGSSDTPTTSSGFAIGWSGSKWIILQSTMSVPQKGKQSVL
ncbi:hypothetical protein OEA41_003678 [Lepraria neglecta]|uniref:Uncharacterized protein n=1 Tax=Lepraria neglecta TaxID=209136 RepID=A0AAE0DJ48_9LECA|nr:hypothetical protein OEA41_003678 [Lepraria neglecta]